MSSMSSSSGIPPEDNVGRAYRVWIDMRPPSPSRSSALNFPRRYHEHDLAVFRCAFRPLLVTKGFEHTGHTRSSWSSLRMSAMAEHTSVEGEAEFLSKSESRQCIRTDRIRRMTVYVQLYRDGGSARASILFGKYKQRLEQTRKAGRKQGAR